MICSEKKRDQLHHFHTNKHKLACGKSKQCEMKISILAPFYKVRVYGFS